MGTAKKKENSAAAFLDSFWVSPPTIVAADRDIPGINAIHWNKPITNALR